MDTVIIKKIARLAYQAAKISGVDPRSMYEWAMSLTPSCHDLTPKDLILKYEETHATSKTGR